MLSTVWPSNAESSRTEKLILKMGGLPGYCNICGSWTLFRVNDANFREHVVCCACGSRNRQRQVAGVLLALIHEKRSVGLGGKFLNIRDIKKNTIVWNVENTRALHESLKAHLDKSYISSEYIDPKMSSGDHREGVLHVDICKTHFDDNSIDYILSSDVLEHVPDPLVALRETYRILKPGGAHIFTVPFYQHRFTTERRAVMHSNGSIEHLRKAWYHDDPIRPEGVLCYNVFAIELLCDIERAGFEAKLILAKSMINGILGGNGVVLAAVKKIPPSHALDFIFG